MNNEIYIGTILLERNRWSPGKIRHTGSAIGLTDSSATALTAWNSGKTMPPYARTKNSSA
jgi:hypothetical protein